MSSPRRSRRKWSVVGLLALVASAIFLLPVSQAAANTVNNACVNSAEFKESALIPVTMTAEPSLASIKAGEEVTLNKTEQILNVPAKVFVTGFNLGILKEGVNEVPVEVLTKIIGTNTVQGQQIVEAKGKAVTTITGPKGENATATPGEVKLTYPSTTWKASGGTINFREKTESPLEFPTVSSPGGIKINAIVVPSVLEVRFDCSPGTVVESANPSTITYEEAAPFASVAGTNFALTLSTTGSGSGSFKCDTGSGAGPCAAEYGEGTKVKVTAEPSTGSKFVAFGGDCTGASCELTMNEAHSVSAEFVLESRSLAVTQEGEGSVACEVNAKPEPCTGEYLYGSAVKVTATPAVEWNVGSLTGSGSAAGKCSVEAKSCTFTLTANSSVAVLFEAAGTKAKAEGKVFGEVPQTTSIESGCSTVFLGKFLPGVEKAYENSCGVIVTSTGEETTLTAADETGVDTGFLTQKLNEIPHSYTLAKPLLVGAQEKGEGGGTGPLGGALLAPVKLLTWTKPISKDLVGVGFRQEIGEHEGLHTGVYAKTITLTLQQTTP